MFHRVLIANRGEIAVRIARACRELGITPVHAYSAADRETSYVKAAERSICIGPARSQDSYLDQNALLAAAEQTLSGALHPGYGFLSENDLFAERCASRKIKFVGPSSTVMRQMARKSEAREVMRSIGIPVIPGSRGVLANVAQARTLAAELGYPVLLKADAGGGGRGLRRCDREEDLQAAYDDASREAQAAFSSGALYLEKYIEGGRHIEFQVVGDSYGGAVCLGERECSVQRRHQKLIEEAPSVVVDAVLRAELGERCAQAVRALRYEGAGTLEFLRDRSGKLYFMEMNTRLQVEHPVTEMIFGVDLVVEQLKVAAGHRLSLEPGEPRGHAIECRINAEDPDDGFKPSPGVIESLTLPEASPQVRVETHIEAGYEIPPHYDSLLMKLIVHGDTRDAAREGMLAALDQLRVEGVKTTTGLHQSILASDEFRLGELDVTRIPGWQED